jgi:chemotaxis protein histidine kinase CheA
MICLVVTFTLGTAANFLRAQYTPSGGSTHGTDGGDDRPYSSYSNPAQSAAQQEQARQQAIAAQQAQWAAAAEASRQADLARQRDAWNAAQAAQQAAQLQRQQQIQERERRVDAVLNALNNPTPIVVTNFDNPRDSYPPPSSPSNYTAPAPYVDYAAQARAAEAQRLAAQEAEYAARKAELLAMRQREADQAARRDSTSLRRSINAGAASGQAPEDLSDLIVPVRNAANDLKSAADDLFDAPSKKHSDLKSAADDLLEKTPADAFALYVESLKKSGQLDWAGQGAWSQFRPVRPGSMIYYRTRIIAVDTVGHKFTWAVNYHNRGQRKTEVVTRNGTSGTIAPSALKLLPGMNSDTPDFGTSSRHDNFDFHVDENPL